jgi:hypothetical protein
MDAMAIETRRYRTLVIPTVIPPSTTSKTGSDQIDCPADLTKQGGGAVIRKRGTGLQVQV